MVYNKPLLLTYFLYSSLCLLIPYSCNLSLLSPLSPGNHKFVFCVCVSVSALYIDSFVLFKIPHIKDTKYNILQVHSCCCKGQYFILFMAEHGEGHDSHSSILAWEIPWTEELGGLQSIGS